MSSLKNNYCVIMAGGVGTRFWPMSRTTKPKQFIDILGVGKTLIQLTFERFRKICPPENVFVVTVNRNNEILVEGDKFMTVDKIREEAVKFIDNGGGLGNPINDAEPAECDWCEGAKDPASSDHPNKAIISLESDRGTSYGTYIAVQNELVGAYTDLRNRLSTKLYGVTYTQLIKDAKNSASNESLKEKIKNIKSKYPQIISEAEPTK